MKTSTTPVSSFHIGPKGRFVLPAAIRRLAGLEEGTEVVAVVVGEGRVMLETAAAIRDRVWAGAPSSTEYDATADVRAMRTEDVLVADQSYHSRTEASAGDGEDVGAAFLAELGL